VDIAIHLSQETMERLKACAEPFVDRKPEDVIRRLLDQFEKADGRNERDALTRLRKKYFVSSARQNLTFQRAPRERGVTVQIDGHQIVASSVRDLLGQALMFLVDRHRTALDQILPFRTSSERYLVAKQDMHPNGKPFFVRAPHNGYRGYYMEAHKDYKNAIAHLGSLLKKLGLKFEYVG
jgi:hypothetical protein